MKSLLRWTLAFSLLSLTNCAAHAQNQPSPCAPASHVFGLLQVSSTGGCPFSATVEILRTQSLADGTHIQTKTKSLVYRDSYGRVSYYTYKPVGLDEPYPDSPNLIEIEDPVAEFVYFLLPQSSHVAIRHSLIPAAHSSSPGDHAAPASSRPEPKFTSEQLGTQDILGYVVTGRRTTRTFPAGMEHNDRPITVVIEIWRSQEFGLVFLRKASDPRNGDEEVRVTSFEQSEPDPGLFQLPSGYTVQDQRPR
jgi:hypothetical protein